jgi:predicted ATPase
MDFTPFTVIAGINASGKSNLFDALELLSRLSQYSLREAFQNPKNRGSVNEVFSIVGQQESSNIEFVVEMLVNRKVKDNWGIEKEIKSPRLRYELHIERRRKSDGYDDLVVTYESLDLIKISEDRWAKEFIPTEYTSLWKSTQHGGSKPFITTETKNGITSINMRQDTGRGGKNTPTNTVNQTVLSSVTGNDFPHVFAAKTEMMSWQFMQFNPEELRKPTNKETMSNIITHDGKNLAAALWRIKEEEGDYVLTEIARELTRFLPEYIGIDVKNDEANRQFLIRLKNKDGEYFSSRVLSEGTLRLLALTIIQFDNKHKGLLCFEEPENGIHPKRIKQMAELLFNLSADYENETAPLRQVIVNTHSPILIKELLRWDSEKNVSVWLSKMATDILDFNDQRAKMRVTKMNRVSNSPQKDAFWKDFTPRSTADLEDYLSTITDNGE